MTIRFSARLLVTLGALAVTSALAGCTDAAPEPGVLGEPGEAALVAPAAGAAGAAGAKAAAATDGDATGRPVTDAELARIVSQPGFAETRELIAEQGGEIALSDGLVYTYANGVAGTETRFSVSTADGQAPADDLVFQQADREAYFYFLAQTTDTGTEPIAQSTDAQTSGIFGCGAWSSWAFVGTYCGNHFWCFGKNQKGTYAKYTRTRQCRNGIQQANRTNFVGCGC
jgi:hypothetical protein